MLISVCFIKFCIEDILTCKNLLDFNGDDNKNNAYIGKIKEQGIVK